MKYRYIPAVGQAIRLATFEAYTASFIHPWSWLRILSAQEHLVRVELLDGDQSTGQTFLISPEIVQPPIGWREIYEIRAAPDKVQQVLSWLQGGIVVRQWQYMGDPSVTFQPADNCEQPHWKFCEITDIVPPEQTDDRIRVIQTEYMYDAFIPAVCSYCRGTGKRSASDGTGYAGPDMACWRCKNGQAALYISGLRGKERKAAIAQLQADGWTGGYERRGRAHWWAERETVIKEAKLAMEESNG